MKRLLTILFVLLALTAKAQTLHFHQLTVKDGLPHNSIITLAQDTKGNIWVATHGGLFCYDGKQFYAMPSEELPDKRVDRINRAPDGTMWVQCFEHHSQVSRYDTLSHHFMTYDVSNLTDSLRQQVVLPLNRTFADPHSSRMWTIEKRQLWQTDSLHPDSPLIYTGQTALDAGLRDETFYSLLLDRQGILWAGSANNGLFFADTRQSHYRRLVCQPNPLVRATLVDKEGTLWIGIGDQQLLTLPKEAAYTTHVDYPMTDSVEGRRLRAIVEDSKGRLWLGTHDGLYMKENSTANFQRMAIEGDATVPVYSLCKDEDSGVLWIGTDRGLYRLPLEEQHPQALLVDSTATFIGKITIDRKKVWMTTEIGLFCRADGKTTQWHQESTHQIVIDARGQMWVGTDNGLLRVTEQGVQPVSTAADGHIIKDMVCWRDFLWCSHEQGLCCVNIYTGQSTTLHTEHNEYLDGSACLDVHTGTLYFGGTLGIDCLQADSLEEKLRSGVSQLWLEEENEVISEDVKSNKSLSTTWYYWLLALFIAGCIAAYYLFRKAKASIVEEVKSEEVKSERGLTPSPFTEIAKAITEAHMADADFTAEQMASEMAMSRSKLFLLMKKETGKAVMEFVRDIRLDYAAQQLEAGIPVNDIYMACGFSDPSSFRRSFVKKFGINPSQYRSKDIKK